jgi:hypothetical protein
MIVLELETSRARLQIEKEQLQNEVREIERRKGIQHLLPPITHLLSL